MKDPLAKRIIIFLTVATLFGFVMYEMISLINSISNRQSLEVASLTDAYYFQEESIENEQTNKSNTTKKQKKSKNENVDENENKNEEKKQKKKEEPTGSSPYYIKVNRQANTITVYTKDEKGKYTVPIRAMICTTGYATPYGTYPILAKGNWWPLYGDVYGQYAMHVVGNILFHSVPYLEKNNKASIEWWEYDKLRNNSIYGMYKIAGN